MPNIFSGGLKKLAGTRAKGSADAASSTREPENLGQYEGKLSAGHFGLSEGSVFGLGAVQPQTLAYEPCCQLIAVCSNEGHMQLFGADIALCVKNPCAPVRVEFLLFPRPGFALLLGVAPGVGGASPRWLAQWWDLQEAGQAERKICHTVALRFGVTAVAVAEGTALVFLGTDEGDVRVFDAGVPPGLADYCVPWPRLQSTTEHAADARPCPVTALAMAPGGVCELLVGGAEGCIALWGIERQKNLRTFDAEGAVNSMVWHQAGASFVVAARLGLLVFNKGSSNVVAKVPLPGGPAQSATLLRWSSVEGPRKNSSPQAGEAPLHGELLLRRGSPGAAVLNLWGKSWSQVDKVLESAALEGAVVCAPPGAAEGAEVSRVRAYPPGALVPPWAVSAEALPEDMTESDSTQLQVLDLFASSPVVLAVVVEPCHRLMVATLPPAPPLVWPAAWGTLEMAGVTAHCVPVHRHSSPASKGTEAEPQQIHEGSEEQGKDASNAAEDPTDWTEAEEEQLAEQETAIQQQFERFAEAMFARRFANFVSFLDGRGTPVHEGTFVKSWNSMTGGWLGTFCTGHCDGTVRLWLRSHSDLLLLHTISIFSLAPTLTRPQVAARIEGMPASEMSFAPAESLANHDAVDACPAVFAQELDDDFYKASITSIAFEPKHGMLAAASGRGCIALFAWQCAASKLPVGEIERWASTVLRDAKGTSRVSAEAEEAVPLSSAVRKGEEGDVDVTNGPEEDSEVTRAPEKDSEANDAPEGSSEATKATEDKPELGPEEDTTNGLEDAAAIETSDECVAAEEVTDSGLLLPTGFVCEGRFQEHIAPITRLQFVEVADGALHLVAADTSGHLLVVDVQQKKVLFAGSPAGSPEASPLPAGDAAGAPPPPPPAVIVQSFVFSEQVLRVATDNVQGLSASIGASSSSTTSKRDNEVAAARIAAEMALKLMSEGDEGDPNVSCAPSGAYVLVLSDGSMRQLTVPEMRILDSRIQQSRLPTLPSGLILLQSLTPSFMIIVQANAAHIMMRHHGGELSPLRSTTFDGRAVSASLQQVHGEDCLYLLMATLTIQVFALPSMALLSSIDTTPKADPFLVQLSLSKSTASANTQPANGFSPGERGACMGEDGYLAFRSGGSVGSRIWLASCQAECSAFDAAAWIAPVARIRQAAAQAPIQVDVQTAPPPSSSSNAKGIGGLLGSLLGAGGTAAPRGARAAIRPSGGLAAEVDGTRIDKSRGVAKAAEECDAVGKPLPQCGAKGSSDAPDARAQLFGGKAKSSSAEAKPQSETSGIAGAQAEMAEAHKKASERGEKISDLALKSQQMQQDAEDFLEMAKKLNQRNNRWF